MCTATDKHEPGQIATAIADQWRNSRAIATACSPTNTAAPPGPGPGPGPPPPGGSAGVRKKLAEVRPTGGMETKLLALARTYLERSDRITATNRFASGRDLVAADALVHAAEHQQHIAERTGPGPPPRDEIARHLEDRLRAIGRLAANIAHRQ